MRVVFCFGRFALNTLKGIKNKSKDLACGLPDFLIPLINVI
jgi:hypothetical protein